MSYWKNREEGKENPAFNLGLFRIRFPFIHYRFEWPDYFQGLLMCAVDLAAIPLIIELLGMPFEAAMAIVILNGFFYLLHHLLGDPVVPGWITPAIPIIIVYIETFSIGPDRVKALMAFQFMLGLLSVFLGTTKLATKIIRLIPSAIKSGIIIGAGIAAVTTVFKAGGRFDIFPYTITISVSIAFYLIYSQHFRQNKEKYRLLNLINKLGIFPIIILAVFIAPLFKETNWPQIEWGFSNPDFNLLIRSYTIFGVGLPPISMFLTAIPTVLATYIVLFGDVLQSKAILEEADSIRADEKIDYNSNRAHVIFGGRNSIMSFIGPDITMCGPLWAAMHVVIVERYKQGKKAMHSIIGGSGSFRWGTNTGLLLLPIVTLVKPILGVALALTLIIQGFVSVRIGVMESKSQKDLGIAGVTAALLVAKGAAWAFGVGILLVFLLYGKNFFKDGGDDNHSQFTIFKK
ncbi:MAG: hypothetical protein ACJ0QA_02705 [Flavobacteriaceae bacterium]